MQAEYSDNRGNGFIISPSQCSFPTKSRISPPIEASGKLSDIKEGLSTAKDACTSYAKSSGRLFLCKALSALVAVCCVLSFFHFFTFATGIYLDGEKIAVTAAENDYLTALAAAKTTAAGYGITELNVSFTTSPVLSLRTSVSSLGILRDKILLASDRFVAGCTLYSGNTPIFNAESSQLAKSVVDEYISSYSMNGDASLSSSLTYKNAVIAKSEVLSKEDCLRLLSESNSVSVVSVVNTTSSKVLPFETQTENDDTLYIGETVTVTEGKNGTAEISQETVYENGSPQSSRITRENVTAQPVKQVVKVGTKYKKILESGVFYPLRGVLSSPFGARWGSVHEGIDIAVAEGTPVKAAECGVVSYVSENAGGYGKFVRIDHGYGVETAYAHLSKIQVSVGQAVSSDTVIALSGNTGRSTGPHLHFEITQNDAPVDPLLYLKN